MAHSITICTVFCLLLTGCYEHHWEAGRGPMRELPVGEADTLPCEEGWVEREPAGLPPPPCEIAGPGDHDGDGFDNAVDCNDCSAQINPGAYDFPGNDVDEDCDGVDGTACDDIGDSSGAIRAARALGLCQQAEPGGDGWGLLSARFTNANGTAPPGDPTSVSVVSELGPVRPRSGAAMLSLSTDGAETDCVDHLDWEGAESIPAGVNVDSADCPLGFTSMAYNAAALELEIRVPTNVSAYELATHFFTHEYPDFVCTEFNDVFVVLQSRDGVLENVVFDALGNPVTVNNALLRACEGGRYGGREFRCDLGRGPLEGTGFEVQECAEEWGGGTSGAGTGCISTVSRVVHGEIMVLRMVIWNTGDSQLDSLALLDGFQWIPDPFEAIAP